MLEFFRFILEFYRRYSLVVGNMPIDKDVCGDILGASAHMSESAEGITLVLTLDPFVFESTLYFHNGTLLMI